MDLPWVWNKLVGLLFRRMLGWSSRAPFAVFCFADRAKAADVTRICNGGTCTTKSKPRDRPADLSCHLELAALARGMLLLLVALALITGCIVHSLRPFLSIDQRMDLGMAPSRKVVR